MISCENLGKIFKSQGLTYFTGVPDSTFKEWMSFLNDENGNGLTNRIAAIERDAIGWAAGYNVATGKIGVVYMQNSGLGNTVNPITSLTDPEVYNIPILLMVGWRGEPGKHDEPQHIKMGRITIPLLDVMEINHSILPDSAEEAEKTINEALENIKKTGKPFALIVRSGIFEEYKGIKKTGYENFEMTREDAIKTIVETITGDEIIISTTGKASRELFEIRKNGGMGHERDFLMVGSMGLASSFAAEIALQKPNRKVFIFDGDGAALMSEGNLATMGFYCPKNLFHIVIDNGAYESTGGQPTISVDFAKIALANGYKGAKKAETKKELKEGIKEITKSDGPQMLVVKVKRGSRKDLGRPTTSPVENKKLFMDFLSKN